MTRGGGRGRRREGWRLRHITFPQCIKGTGLSVTHTVGGGMERRQKEEEMGETEWRKRGAFFLTSRLSPSFHRS